MIPVAPARARSGPPGRDSHAGIRLRNCLRQLPRWLLALAICLWSACTLAGDVDGNEQAQDGVDDLVRQAEALAKDDPRASVAMAERAIARLPAGAARRLEIVSAFCLQRVMYAAEDALQVAERGAAAALKAGDRASHARYLACRGYAQEKSEGTTAALASYDLGVREAEASGDRETIADLYAYRGELRHYLGDYEHAIDDLDASYRLYRETGSGEGQRYALNAMANLYSDPNVGEHARAIEYYRQLLDHDLKEGVQAEIATAYYNIAGSYEALGRLDEALADYSKALAIDTRRGDAESVAQEKLSIGSVLRKQGDAQASLQWIEQAMAHHETHRQPEGIAGVRVQRGQTLAALGRTREALEDLGAAAEFFSQQDNPRVLATIHGETAAIHAAAGEWRSAYTALVAQREARKVLDQRLIDRQTQRLRVEFDSSRKEQENQRLQQENLRRESALRNAERVRGLQRLIILLGAALVLLLAAMALQQYRRNRRIRQLALTDELTGLPNRRSILGFLETEWKRREPDAALAVIAFDIDHFKRINDACGHAGGDSVLRGVGENLQRTLRDGYRAGRMGGEEFMVVLPGADAATARQVAEALRTSLREHGADHLTFEARKSVPLVTASFGIGECHNDDSDVAVILKRADDALYRAKREGRDRVVEG